MSGKRLGVIAWVLLNWFLLYLLVAADGSDGLEGMAPGFSRRLGRSVPEAWFGIVLGANGIALLIVSNGVQEAWWQALWLELGAAALLGAAVDFALALHRRHD